ncbi:unnamed protein product [Amoebophrya sp. A25]|nr:unnamed protein product [Amoebophrya sp. A25]|eukprot:GSA25T00002988001.1
MGGAKSTLVCKYEEQKPSANSEQIRREAQQQIGSHTTQLFFSHPKPSLQVSPGPSGGHGALAWRKRSCC